ncbi:O-antigen ligase family protein [Formosa sp. 3Alg 14/1]|uniref:O-antigen ligase family protein n=1 Tax=Formosa sp. 3Alg 14/1 TaxID=3382190 RepID=UPI0039BDF38A
MQVDKRSLLFILYVLIFALDSVINYFFDIPLFVISLIFYFALLIIPGFFSLDKYGSFVVIVFSFSLSFIVNALRTGFYKESLSDYLFIMAFFGSFYLFSNSNRFKANKFMINLFIVLSLLLFLATFLGFDQNIWGNTMGLETNDIEFSRSYRQGFFRKAHIASYFFTFIVLYLINRYNCLGKSKFTYIYTLSPLVLIIFLTGSRTPFVVILLGLCLYYFKAKFLKYLIALMFLGVLLFVYIDKLLTLFSNTVIYQYLSIVKTITSNFDRLSRVIIWTSWWKEIKTFSFIDFIFGRGFNASMEANLKNVSSAIWFHNDFLSISYSYGFLPLVLYVMLFVQIFRTNKQIIKSNIFIYLTFSSFWLSAFFNGFYYYFTILILYLFYSMIYEKNEVSNFRN